MCGGKCLKTQESEAVAQVLKDLGKPFLSGTGAVSPRNSKVKGEDHMNQEEGCTCRHKHREVTEERGLMNRLNRIEGQIRGIKSMVEDERYCVDIITQVAAVQAALNSFNKVLLERHIKSCVVDDIRRGDSDATVEELCRTLQKMMK
ncbi:hypothetical protein CLOBOL_05857 [Enterocloster bolteae ATCC BAA-613]|nr:hypothetical protein CLOBOL_05857 [Enterocloster bolteae ATCC BAA-613]